VEYCGKVCKNLLIIKLQIPCTIFLLDSSCGIESKLTAFAGLQAVAALTPNRALVVVELRDKNLEKELKPQHWLAFLGLKATKVRPQRTERKLVNIYKTDKL
jgi:hypothetical protein